MEVIKILKGGSLSRTIVVSYDGKKFVRKSISFKENREYGLVRWHSQIRKIQTLNRFMPDSSICIENMGIDGDAYYYEAPYYEGSKNCYDALLNGESPDLLATKISILLGRMAEVGYRNNPGALAIYINEEVLLPLVNAFDLANSGMLSLQPNESSVFIDGVAEAIEIAKKIILKTRYAQIHESLTHGNLTLENIIWDSQRKEVIMIDPYAETYCETIIGDVSQLLQSSRSGYEFISNLLENNPFRVDRYPTQEIPTCLIDFSNCLLQRVSINSWFSEEYLSILSASQFIRMFPFKQVTNPRQGLLFLYHGIQLLQKALC
jgi:hypothetical protein